MRTVLFLGAGSSAPAGCPTTDGLRLNVLINVRKRLGGPINGDELTRLKFLEQVINDSTLDDIEKVYSCATRILDSHNKYSGVVLDRMGYSHDHLGVGSGVVFGALRALEGIIRETVLDDFAVADDHAKNMQQPYDRLFDVAGGASGSVDILTTNYDNVIEAYCRHTDRLLIDGFEPSKNGDHRVWKDSWDEDGGIRLIKLHGSVTWQRTGDQIIGMREPGNRDKTRDILIAPTLEEKDYGNEPFPQLFKQCDMALSRADALVVIGYSFRDTTINEKFVGAVERGTSMLVISPNAENDVKQNLKPRADLIEGDKPGIEVMQKKFQPDTVDDVCGRLEKFLNRRRRPKPRTRAEVREQTVTAT